MIHRAFVAAAALAALLSSASAQVSAFEQYAGTAAAPDNAAYGAFLEKYVAEGETGVNLVDYAGVADADAAALDGYLASLQAIDPTALSRDDAFAYWVNLYNALTLKLIIDEYPVRSIREIKSGFISIGPWGRKLARINGVELTLNDIEHEILRAFWDEPRVHYAVNCASIGCPNLMDRPWEGASLNADLDAAARAYIAHPRGVRVEGDRVIASTIFKWFRKDFGANEAEVLEHIRGFADADKRARLDGADDINAYEYDWALNEVKR